MYIYICNYLRPSSAFHYFWFLGYRALELQRGSEGHVHRVRRQIELSHSLPSTRPVPTTSAASPGQGACDEHAHSAGSLSFSYCHSRGCTRKGMHVDHGISKDRGFWCGVGAPFLPSWEVTVLCMQELGLGYKEPEWELCGLGLILASSLAVGGWCEKFKESHSRKNGVLLLWLCLSQERAESSLWGSSLIGPEANPQHILPVSGSGFFFKVASP